MRGVPERDHLSENNSSHKVLTQKRVLTTLKIKKKIIFFFSAVFFSAIHCIIRLELIQNFTMKGVLTMQTLIKPSAAIRQNYSEIANLCKQTGEPVFLTKNGEGDLVVMDITAYDQREKQLELREKLIEVEEQRRAGIADIPARTVSENLRSRLKEKAAHV